MRIYDGSPRQDFEEVLRSIGAVLDQRGMREISLTEVPDGFIVQGLVIEPTGSWTDQYAQLHKETLSFVDDDIARFMEEGLARREHPVAVTGRVDADRYENALRVLGHYIDQQHPRDVFFFEQEGAYVLRLLISTQGGGSRHLLVEFTRDEVAGLVAQAPESRGATTGSHAG